MTLSQPNLDPILYCIIRLWHSRFAYLASLLILLLQRSPVLRSLIDCKFASLAPRFAHVFKFTAATTAVNALSTHAVTGATAPVVTPVDSPNPAQAAVGEEFVWVWSAAIPGKKARSYLVEGLPPGIEWDGSVASNSFTAMTGTPTVPGTYTVEITAFHRANLGGDASPLYELIINVTGDAPPPPVLTTKLERRLARVGEMISLAVEAEGNGIAFEWSKDGNVIPDSNMNEIVLENLSGEDAGFYTVKASNAGGEVTSSAELQVITTDIPIPDGHTLYSGSNKDNLLRMLDVNGGTVATQEVTLENAADGVSAAKILGLAWDGAGAQLFALLELNQAPAGETGNRILATLDHLTGVATLVGNPSADELLKFSGIAINGNGELFGVTGDDPNAVNPESLYFIDKTTAAPSLIRMLGNGDQGEAIAFSTDDGLLYHVSGGAPPQQEQVFEVVDVENQSLEIIQTSGSWTEGKGLAYLGNGLFLLTDNDTARLLSISGEIELAGALDHFAKGLALIPTATSSGVAAITSVAHSDNEVVLQIAAASGQVFEVESSRNLIEWETIGGDTVAADSSVSTFTVPNQPDAARYYRVRTE